jgi:hypothetical protein
MTSQIKIGVSKSEAVLGNNTLPRLFNSDCDFKSDDKANACQSDYIRSTSDSDESQRLGHQFGMSISTARKIFSRTVPILAHFFKELICWPSKIIKRLLPIPFRHTYSNVQSIIDCLEIEI